MIIKIAGKAIELSTIEAYVIHLRKDTKDVDTQVYEEERRQLHNAIFLEAGFWDIGKCPARIVQKDSQFGREIDDLLCHILTCPKEGHGTTDRNASCFKCGRFITIEDNLQTLRNIATDQFLKLVQATKADTLMTLNSIEQTDEIAAVKSKLESATEWSIIIEAVTEATNELCKIYYPQTQQTESSHNITLKSKKV